MEDAYMPRTLRAVFFMALTSRSYWCSHSYAGHSHSYSYGRSVANVLQKAFGPINQTKLSKKELIPSTINRVVF